MVETVLTKLGRPTDTATMDSLLRRSICNTHIRELLTYLVFSGLTKMAQGRLLGKMVRKSWAKNCNQAQFLFVVTLKSTFSFADEFLLVVALMDVTDMAAIEDSAFSTGFLVFDQVLTLKGFTLAMLKIFCTISCCRTRTGC